MNKCNWGFSSNSKKLSWLYSALQAEMLYTLTRWIQWDFLLSWLTLLLSLTASYPLEQNGLAKRDCAEVLLEYLAWAVKEQFPSQLSVNTFLEIMEWAIPGVTFRKSPTGNIFGHFWAHALSVSYKSDQEMSPQANTNMPGTFCYHTWPSEGLIHHRPEAFWGFTHIRQKPKTHKSQEATSKTRVLFTHFHNMWWKSRLGHFKAKGDLILVGA